MLIDNYEDAMRESYRFVVAGRVQGVYFRQSTCDRAMALGLHGWVRNRMDGAVEGVVAGDDAAALGAFREWLGKGPPAARVASVEWEAVADQGDTGFGVRR
ncbi:MAG TPA: acylphosphatase [Nevskiaceae bacterium]|nr:acylphosphatase [Nevskiaceae bacterium]